MSTNHRHVWKELELEFPDVSPVMRWRCRACSIECLTPLVDHYSTKGRYEFTEPLPPPVEFGCDPGLLGAFDVHDS